MGKKSSRLHMLLHLWGGICLKTFADISGLSKTILAPLEGSDQASASRYSVATGILTIGIIVAGYFMSSSLVKKIDSSSMSKKTRTIIKVLLPAIYFIGVILLAMLLAPGLSSADDYDSQKAIMVNDKDLAPVFAYNIVQSAEGITDSDMNQEGLKNIETWLVNRIIERSRQKYAEMGYDPATFNPKVDAKSLYMTVSGEKLIIIRINLDNAMRTVSIMGIRGNELHRVNCVRESNHDIPIWSGVCGKKVKEVFGVDMHPEK